MDYIYIKCLNTLGKYGNQQTDPTDFSLFIGIFMKLTIFIKHIIQNFT